MERIPVKSSSVKSIGYDPLLKELHVEYNNGGVYAYHNVTDEHYKALMNAQSKGKHIVTRIKPHFKHSKV